MIEKSELKKARQITQGKRNLTLDRIDEVSKLLQLSYAEKIFLKEWLQRIDPYFEIEFQEKLENKKTEKKKNVSLNLLNDWLNVYVKDCFQLENIQKNPELIFSQLAHISSRKRIQKSLNFLLREGYLRTTIDGRIVIETELAIAESPTPSQRIRQFHKNALKIAQNSVETIPMNLRYLNTLVLPLNPEKYQDLISLIQDFSMQLKKFTEDITPSNEDQLYQFNLNLVPTGRKDI
ncbi:MAG: hypothetical protein A2622_12640 [Bdellovibrionales bacterium RIFCSPHIGHO2_01_FULL_40_29]|nr:MAG: hypothetical protein A2622_12640 [Bdellovibrionales bacterium RIFCSPHIGHO2_01_FULL_40_29]OFZ33458.1 MAG: hypothetical protein A3D17_14245 [Bdellovibrionales bacterium RIFCSPHIGHO2_02_FULL_40_15]